MRRWHHEVSAEWLEHRQQVLTATDVVNLLPEYKRYVKAGEPEDKLFPGFAALWCSKHSKGYLDTESQAAAARGHVMEPYAVTAWNKQAKPEFHHWDDCIITKGLCGFSPDATTVEQPKGIVQMSHFFLSDLDEIMEVKSYLPDHHMKCFVEDRMEHREIMQVAMAFKILDQLETAHIGRAGPDVRGTLRQGRARQRDHPRRQGGANVREAGKAVRGQGRECQRARRRVHGGRDLAGPHG